MVIEIGNADIELARQVRVRIVSVRDTSLGVVVASEHSVADMITDS
jgi:hypothetical protein